MESGNLSNENDRKRKAAIIPQSPSSQDGVKRKPLLSIENRNNTDKKKSPVCWHGVKPEWKDRALMNKEVPPKKTVYKYRRESLKSKTKAERRQIPGQSCCMYCENFWKKKEELTSSEECQRLKNLVSRHRDYHPHPITPPGFWNPVFSDSE